MISKKLFKKVIKAIQKQNKKEHDFCDAIEKIVDGRIVPQMSVDLHEVLIKILEEIFDDEIDEYNNWLTWWMYEKDYGKNKKMIAWDNDNKEIKLDTVDELYNFLMKNKIDKMNKK